MQESSVPGLHNADTRVHSMEGSQIARQWQPKTGTGTQKQRTRDNENVHFVSRGPT